MSKIKPRATRSDIFQRLERLVGTDAEPLVEHVADLLDHGVSRDAIDTLKSYDDTLGGYCSMPANWSKPDGAYRPLGYMAYFLENPHPREMARYIVDLIGQHVENLLQRIATLGFLSSISTQLFPMGRLVKSMQPFLPRQLYDDLQWLASEVYNHAKHSVDVFHRATPEEKAHYFQLEEALAIYLIGRKLAVQLEQWGGKSREKLMAEKW